MKIDVEPNLIPKLYALITDKLIRTDYH